jgi:signal transduction histidine kinase
MSLVLIVDDSQADRVLFRTLLGRHGFSVVEAAMGREALPIAREQRPHVIILDVGLPDVDGPEVCRALRADPSCAGIPVLMLTVRDKESDILAGLEAGADDYVPKDAAPEIILARVRHLAQYRQMAVTSVLNEQLVQIGRLLAGIVHEIRGPLNVIRGHAEVLKLQALAGADAQVREHVDPILRGCQLLQVRLEHLMAAVRGGPSQSVPIDPANLVRESANMFLKGTDSRRNNVEFRTDLPAELPRVDADPGRLMQVLLNLFGNAYEAVSTDRPEGGEVTVRAMARPSGGRAGLEVEVIDNGPGIPEHVLPRVFEPFFTTKSGGSGYGLYLASQIVHEHGGELTASNLPSGGAAFTMWLPARQNHEGHAGTPDATETQGI